MSNATQVGDYLNITVYSFCNNQVGINSFWFQVSAAGPPAATDADYASVLSTTYGWPTLWRTLQSPASQYYGLAVRIVRPGSPTFLLASNTTGQGVGTTGAGTISTQTTGVLAFQTALAGRAYRGRAYLPFPSANYVAATGLPTASWVTAGNAIGASLLSGINVAIGGRTGSATFGIYHRPRIGPPPIPAKFTAVTEYVTRPLWGTQRRRGDYGRTNLPPF